MPPGRVSRSPLLSYIESGAKSPTADTLDAICSGLEVSLLDLIKLNEKPQGAQKLNAFAANSNLNLNLPEEAFKELEDFAQFLYNKYRKK